MEFEVSKGPNVGLPISDTRGPNVSCEVSCNGSSNLHTLGLVIYEYRTAVLA